MVRLTGISRGRVLGAPLKPSWLWKMPECWDLANVLLACCGRRSGTARSRASEQLAPEKPLSGGGALRPGRRRIGIEQEEGVAGFFKEGLGQVGWI